MTTTQSTATDTVPPGNEGEAPAVVIPAGRPGPDGVTRPYPVYADAFDLLYDSPPPGRPPPGRGCSSDRRA